MKIAQVVSPFPPYFGGVGNVAYNNSIELARRGYEVEVFTSNFPRNVSFIYPKEIKVNRLNYIFNFGNATLSPGILKINDFDLIHLHLPYHFGGELASLVSRTRKIPLVATYQMDVIGEGWLKYFFKLHEKFFLKAILNNAEKIIVSSMDYAMNSNFRELFEKRKKDLVEVPNGVDSNKFKPNLNMDNLKKKLGIENERIILFVGALDKAHYFKGVEVLLKGFSGIKEKNIKLILVGEGNLKDYYMKRAGELGIKKNVFFAGRVSNEELPYYYNLCDFLVLPSTDRGEAFGLVLVEAMSCGKAVIASNLPGIRSVVENGKNGFLAEAKNEMDLTEKMEKLIEDNKLRKKLGENGRKKVLERYDWERIALKTEEVYNKLV
ncbi:MAG: glycosyltransferase family 4 protein [archaeon]